MDGKNKKVDDLIKVFGYEIQNQLEQFVSDVDPAEIDGNYGYPNNDGSVYGGELEVVSSNIQEQDGRLVCQIDVKQLYEVLYAYEDNEGDRIASGEASLYVYATVFIDCKIDFNENAGKDYNLRVENIGYNVV